MSEPSSDNPAGTASEAPKKIIRKRAQKKEAEASPPPQANETAPQPAKAAKAIEEAKTAAPKKRITKKVPDAEAPAPIAPTAFAATSEEWAPRRDVAPAPAQQQVPAPAPAPAPVAPAAEFSSAPAPSVSTDPNAPAQPGQQGQPPRQDRREGREGRDRRDRWGRRGRNRGRDRDRDHRQQGDPRDPQPQQGQGYGNQAAQQNAGPEYGEYTPPPIDPNVPPPPPEFSEGLVEVSGKGFGFLRNPANSYTQNPNDIFVTPEVCRRYSLRDGQWIKGEIRRGSRGYQLFRLTEIDGEDPETCRELPAFDELTVINPLERVRLETKADVFTTRIIDMMSPIGKGQRGLIVAPPRTGKTTLLEHIANAVATNYPEMKLMVLLVDERPEEVTQFKRTCPTAEIMASSNDSDIKSHTRIAQLCIERAKRLAEMGKDVFILLDSLTRVGRAFNNATSGGPILSGGIGTRSMEIPRRLFAAARNTEEAGSITIIATALIETGSRGDELIFQEFKGTGNMELVLSRAIADMRVYPAADIFLSGTRREELLIPADELHKINIIRRGLSGHKPIEAIERLISFLKRFPNNETMLRSIPG